MATITLKNVPDDLYDQLKRSADRHRRSINREAILCLEQALQSGTPGAQPSAPTRRWQRHESARNMSGWRES